MEVPEQHAWRSDTGQQTVRWQSLLENMYGNYDNIPSPQVACLFQVAWSHPCMHSWMGTSAMTEFSAWVSESENGIPLHTRPCTPTPPPPPTASVPRLCTNHIEQEEGEGGCDSWASESPIMQRAAQVHRQIPAKAVIIFSDALPSWSLDTRFPMLKHSTYSLNQLIVLN